MNTARGEARSNEAPYSPSIRPEHGRRGFVLVLAMLVLLVLSSVGLFALRTSRVDQRSAGNLRMGSQAEYVAEAALQRTVLQMLQNPSGVLTVLTNGASYTMPFVEGMFGESRADYDTFGMAKSVKPQYAVTLSRAIDISPNAMQGTMIGSVGGTTTRFRMKRVDVTATGIVRPADGTSPDGRMSTGTVRAHVVVGPL